MHVVEDINVTAVVSAAAERLRILEAIVKFDALGQNIPSHICWISLKILFMKILSRNLD